MNGFRIKPRKHPGFAVYLFSLLILLSGCSDPLSFQGEKLRGTGAAGQGRVTVYFQGPGEGVLFPDNPASPSSANGRTARSIMPDGPTFTKYKVIFTKGADEIRAETLGNELTQSLDEGTWIVTAEGYVGNGPPWYLAAEGSASAPIEIVNEAPTSPVTVHLEARAPNNGNTTGIFAWNITKNGGTPTDTGQITLQPLFSGSGVSPITLNPPNYSGLLDPIFTGVYGVTVELTNSDNKIAKRSWVAHIYPQLTTTVAYDFTDDDFVSQVMLAGKVTIRKPSALALTGDITVTAYQEAARTIEIGSATVPTGSAFGNGVTSDQSGEWIMKVPVAGDYGLDTYQVAYFTVSVEDTENRSYTVTDITWDSETIPSNGNPNLNLTLNIYGISIPTQPAHGSLSASLPAAVAGTNITLTATPYTDYDFHVGEGPTVTSVTIADPVEVSSTPPYTFTMPEDDVTAAAVFESTLKAITDFYFSIGGKNYGVGTATPPVVSNSGSIDENANPKTVTITVPYGTPVNSMTAAITHNGASIDPVAGSGGNFTTAQTYTVTAENGSTQGYTVTVSNADLSSISVSSPPTITQYDTGPTPIFNTTGLTVNGTDSLGSTFNLTALEENTAFEFPGFNTTVRGDYSVTVKHTDSALTASSPLAITVRNSNANLSDLITAPVSTWNTPFVSETVNYEITVPYGTPSLTLTGTKADTDSGTTASLAYAQSGGVIALSGNPGGTCGTGSVTVTADNGITTKTYTVTVKYGNGINVNGITNAEIPVITFSGSPATVAPGGSVTINLGGGTPSEWHITVDGPGAAGPFTTNSFSIPSNQALGAYTVNVIAVIDGIPYSGSFNLTVQ